MLIDDFFIQNKEEFSRILNSIQKVFKLDSSLPENIFTDQFTNFKFNEFEWLMDDEFWEFTQKLNGITGDNSITISVIDPDPIEYHYKNFKFFNTVIISKDYSAKD